MLNILIQDQSKRFLQMPFMGINMDAGKIIGQVEVDERGRLTIPAKIRDELSIKPGDKLSIAITTEGILLRKAPTKEQVFKELVGCIKTPSKVKSTPESIKSIWKIK